MKPSDLVAFARRDWALLADSKRAFHVARRLEQGSVVNFEIVDQLRAQVHAMHPDFPSAADRQADLEAHILLADRLRRASLCR